MDVDEDVLEVEKEEIKLDRPLLALKNGNENFPSLSYTIDGIQENENVPDVLDKLNVNLNEFNPLCSSETILDDQFSNNTNTISSSEVLINENDEELKNSLSVDVEVCTRNEMAINFPSGLVKNPTKPKKDHLNKKVFKRYKYGGKLQLVSCLKNKDIKKEKRNVKFQDGPDIVSEHIDPVDPWRDVRTPSKTEVVSFYRNSCQKLRSRPIDKVIKQIQDIPDLSCRADTLVLRGCRLDIRSCEALESVFRRVQFENLDLENCSLEEEGATSLLEMIEFYHSSCKLNIACNPKIGMRGWQALCRMLRKTTCLVYLDARRTLLTDMTMPTFGRCLKAGPPLKILHLESVYLSGRPLLILTTAMKYNKILEELYIGDNELTTIDGPPIGAMLTYNSTLQLLDLRNNHLKDIGLAHIGNGLCDQAEQASGGGLSSLILWNNGLTHEGMAYICEGLARTTSLKALNLGQNRLGDFGLQKLKPGLIKNKSIHKLGFLNTKLGSEGAVALAEVLADSLCITRMDIRENYIQVAGLMAFSMALKVNQSLLRLDLDKDIKKEPGMESVMQTVLVDIYNYCHRNKKLLRNEMLSTSSESEAANLSRQSSLSADMMSYEDAFHPESCQQEIVQFSPSMTLDSSTVNKFSFPSNDPAETVPPNVFPAISNSNAVVETSSEKKTSLTENNTRFNRFSVTKILDNLGHHAAGVANKIANNVANIDNKLKRKNSKEKIEVVKTTELIPILDQKMTASNGSADSNSSATSNNTTVNRNNITENDAVLSNEVIDNIGGSVNVTASITSMTDTNDIVHLNIVEKNDDTAILINENGVTATSQNEQSASSSVCHPDTKEILKTGNDLNRNHDVSCNTKNEDVISIEICNRDNLNGSSEETAKSKLISKDIDIDLNDIGLINKNINDTLNVSDDVEYNSDVSFIEKNKDNNSTAEMEGDVSNETDNSLHGENLNEELKIENEDKDISPNVTEDDQNSPLGPLENKNFDSNTSIQLMSEHLFKKIEDGELEFSASPIIVNGSVAVDLTS